MIKTKWLKLISPDGISLLYNLREVKILSYDEIEGEIFIDFGMNEHAGSMIYDLKNEKIRSFFETSILSILQIEKLG